MQQQALGQTPGDPDAVAEALARNYRQLRGTLCRTLTRRLELSATEFEDLYQDAWREVVHRIRAGEQIRSYRAFVSRLMINRWNTILRTRRRHPTIPVDGTGGVNESPTYASPGADEQLELDEKVRLALELIESTPDERRRQVLKLRYGCGLSMNEVQQALGVTRRTYRRLLTEAMHDIYDRLELLANGGWCADRREVLVAYAEGEADANQVDQAKRHLRACPTCQQTFAELCRGARRRARRPVPVSGGQPPA